MTEDAYWTGIMWILRERAGSNGGWPPRDVSKVAGWAVIRMLSYMSRKSPRVVAIDVIDTALKMEKDK